MNHPTLTQRNPSYYAYIKRLADKDDARNGLYSRNEHTIPENIPLHSLPWKQAPLKAFISSILV